MSMSLTAAMLVIAIATIGLVVGSVYLGGGRVAIERQAGRLVALNVAVISGW